MAEALEKIARILSGYKVNIRTVPSAPVPSAPPMKMGIPSGFDHSYVIESEA